MVLMKKFKKAVDDDYEHLSVVTGSMRLVLKGLYKGMLPHESYTVDEILGFCRSLIHSQSPDGSWPVYKEGYSVSEEDSIDFLYFPSQIACAILSHVKQKIVGGDQIEGIDKSIADGLKFIMRNNLEGYGYNSRFQLIESLIILTEGSLIELLNRDPRICPSCYNRIIELKEEFQTLLETGNTKMEFGGDYREQYEFVLKGLESI